MAITVKRGSKELAGDSVGKTVGLLTGILGSII